VRLCLTLALQWIGRVSERTRWFKLTLPLLSCFHLFSRGTMVFLVWCVETKYDCLNRVQPQCHCRLADSLQNESTWSSLSGLSEDVWKIVGNKFFWFILIHFVENLLFSGSFIALFIREICGQPKSFVELQVLHGLDKTTENFGRQKKSLALLARDCRLNFWIKFLALNLC
jgi:ABC-type sugar transport system permease subunit